MKNLQIILGILLVLTSGATSFCQDYEYGKPSELKGLKKVFVQTGDNMTERDNIIAVIEKAKLPGIELLDSIDTAEVLLRFEGGTKQVGDTTLKTGTGQVFISGKSPNRLRLLMSIKTVRDVLRPKKPSTQFANEFITAYKKANGLK